MKNDYVGDIGDFGKLGLFSILYSIDKRISLGVNWYFNNENKNKNDGKHYTYLTKKRKDWNKLKILFPDLYDELYNELINKVNNGLEIIHQNRTIEKLEKISFLKSATTFYREPIPKCDREKWFGDSLKKLFNTEIIFLDPDNGLEYKKGDVKHVLKQELSTYFYHGKSIILYNHRDRKPDNEYFSKFTDLAKKLNLNKNYLKVIRANKGTARDYVFFIQKKHEKLINELVDKLIVDKDYLFGPKTKEINNVW